MGDLRAIDPTIVGAKAAALARARAAGLPVLDGFIVTGTPSTTAPAAVPESVRAAWAALSADGTRPLVVRSSSILEDAPNSSMAGQFTTVVGVSAWTEFVAALARVAASATRVASSSDQPEAPLAILVQPMIVPRIGGVVFGIEPVTGRSDHRVVAAVPGLPEQLVSGTTSGSRYEIDKAGARVAEHHTGESVRISHRDLRRLAALEARCAEIFGTPQDVEWGIDGDDRLWLFQSRPVTTTISGAPQGPVLGPGPVAETFPDPLDRLEQDLWAEPLRRALGSVYALLGVASPKELRRSPLLVIVGGRVAVDLDLLEAGGQAKWYAVSHQARAIRAAWRIGRLRAALVRLGEGVVAETDRALVEAPAMRELTDRQLVAALDRFRDALHSLHCHEMLVGLVLEPGDARLTASSIALRVLERGRADGIHDADLPVRQPIVLVLAPPRIGPEVELPRRFTVPEWSPGEENPASTIREALRVRVRWMQEAGARYAWELGQRLTAAGILGEPQQVRDFDLETLEMTVRGLAVAVHRPPSARPHPRPLPARFRLSDTGVPIPVVDRHPHQGAGAGGGQGQGRVHLGTAGNDADIPDGAVLVVRTLDPRLAPVLARLNGLVAETGSVLAHLSILAREAHVPIVVGLEDATRQFAEGDLVSVDGVTGTVVKLDVDRERDRGIPSNQGGR